MKAIKILLILVSFQCSIALNLPQDGAVLQRQKRLVDLRKSTLTEMIVQQSCYYQEYNRRLTCTCSSSDVSAFLHLNMKYYIFEAGNRIKSVHIRSCKELLVNLDLKMVDATSVPFYFRAIRKVQIENIEFEPSYSDTQELQLVFNNVEQVLLKKLHVEDTLKIMATNIKEMHMVDSTFAHIPTNGIAVSRAKILNIRDSKFVRVSEASVTVEDTKEVTVVKNEMSKNALEVIVAKDGSHLMISCNREFGKPESPECSKKKFTTTTTTTTTTIPPFLVNQGNLRESEREKDRSMETAGISAELIGGIIAGLLVILIIISLFICFVLIKKKRKRDTDDAEVLPLDTDAKKTTEKGEKEEKEELLEKTDDKLPDVLPPEPDLDLDDEDGRARFVSPIWLEEIQKNKIFNRQKSLLSEEGLKEIAEGKKEPSGGGQNNGDEQPHLKKSGKKAHAPPPPAKPLSSNVNSSPKQTTSVVVEEEEIKESSRTESDEELEMKNSQVAPLAKDTESPEADRGKDIAGQQEDAQVKVASPGKDKSVENQNYSEQMNGDVSL